MTAGLAVAAFGLQATLSKPAPGSALALQVLARLETVRSVRGVLELPGGEDVPVSCRRRDRLREVRVEGSLRRLVAGTGIDVASLRPLGVGEQLGVALDLSGCPSFLVDDLVSRLIAGRPTLERHTRAPDGRSGFVLRIAGPRPTVELTVAGRTLQPLRIELTNRGVAVHSDIVRVVGRPRGSPV
jgi:hypothetical protein